MSWTMIKRKCHICKQDVILDQDNVLYFKKKYYHFDCYVEYKLSNKRNKLSKDELVQQTLKLQKLSINEVKDIVDKEKLYKWLQYNYNVVSLPKYFFTKIDSIYDGTYKGLSRGIPAEDLLDMWQRKKKELDIIADKKKRKGEQIDGVGRIQYDLAVLLSKYDSYLSWKEKQKVYQQDQIRIAEETKNKKIDYDKINKTIETQTDNETNINNLVDELF